MKISMICEGFRGADRLRIEQWLTCTLGIQDVRNCFDRYNNGVIVFHTEGGPAGDAMLAKINVALFDGHKVRAKRKHQNKRFDPLNPPKLPAGVTFTSRNSVETV